MSAGAPSFRDSVLAAQTVQSHVVLIERHGPAAYFNEVSNMAEKKITLSPALKARILTALWSKHHREHFDRLMFDVKGFFTPSEAFKLVPLIDGPRKARQVQKRLEKLKDKVKKRKKGLMESEVTDLTRDPHTANFTRSLGKRFKKWVGSLDEDTLDFYALNFPATYWQVMADLCHLRPTDFKSHWFLPFIFGAPAPEGSAVHTYSTLTTETLATAIETHPHLAECYSTIKQRIQSGLLTLNNASRLALARRAPLEDVLWFYEEIVQGYKESDEVLEQRLQKREPIGTERGRMNYPKLMERILLLKQLRRPSADLLLPYAEELLSNINFPENSLRVAVFGDCSSSMDVAIKTATIVSSLLTARLNAHLTFFAGEIKNPPTQPKSAQDVLLVANTIRAYGCTSPAACLYPYYADKQPMDLFIVVTDEEENTSYRSEMFTPLYMKYKTEVNPEVQLFFVSFLNNTDEGEMVALLRGEGVETRQFRLDGRRPDLTKFDELVGLLTLQILDQKGVADVVQISKGIKNLNTNDSEVGSSVDFGAVGTEASEGWDSEGWIEAPASEGWTEVGPKS